MTVILHYVGESGFHKCAESFCDLVLEADSL